MVEQRPDRLCALPIRGRQDRRRSQARRRRRRPAARRVADPTADRRPHFIVAGRILYAYEQGTWNEWHIVFDGGTDGWLSDAQNELAVSFPVHMSKLPTPDQAPLGHSFFWNEMRFSVVSRTLAHYAGVEGELPFEYWDKSEVTFIDLRSDSMDFATLDYSDDAPVLYIGKAVDFDGLRLTNVRTFEGW
jgi:hypothetical protein